jgi:hypothetical protein
MLLLLALSTAEAKKPKTPPPPPVEWHREEGWKGDCWYPPDFEKMQEGDRKLARQRTLEQMKAQWLGQRDDDVKFDDIIVDNVETALLGRPTNIEALSRTNLDQCTAYMKGGSIDVWASWFSTMPRKLTEGECLLPLTYSLFDYLDIGRSWQRPIGFCKGDRVRISATVKDRYRIAANGEWINVEGDQSQKAIGAEYPCNIEGCYVGMLIGRFVTDNGVETIFPIGASTVYTAPENGTFSYTINVTTFYDNKWFKSATIEDRAAITVEPAE